jgi:hypothetical protein
MVTKGASDREALGERLGEAGSRPALPYDVAYSRARGRTLLHIALVALWWRYRSSWACSYLCCCWLCFTGCQRACSYRSGR